MLRPMSSSPRRRYQLRHTELNQKIEELLDAARREATEPEDLEFVRQIMVTGVHFLRDQTSRAELKLVNSALKELRHAFRVFKPYSQLRKVAVFGSARTNPDHPDWIHAHAFAERIVREGWMVITGAGGGIMSAAQGGAGLAVKRGLTNWVVDPLTCQSIGKGVGQAGMSEEAFTTFSKSLFGNDLTKSTELQKGYQADQPK